MGRTRTLVAAITAASLTLTLAVVTVAEAHPIDCTGTHWNAKAQSLHDGGYKCEELGGYGRIFHEWTALKFYIIDWGSANVCPAGQLRWDAWTVSYRHVPSEWHNRHEPYCG